MKFGRDRSDLDTRRKDLDLQSWDLLYPRYPVQILKDSWKRLSLTLGDSTLRILKDFHLSFLNTIFLTDISCLPSLVTVSDPPVHPPRILLGVPTSQTQPLTGLVPLLTYLNFFWSHGPGIPEPCWSRNTSYAIYLISSVNPNTHLSIHIPQWFKVYPSRPNPYGSGCHTFFSTGHTSVSVCRRRVHSLRINFIRTLNNRMTKVNSVSSFPLSTVPLSTESSL